MYNLISHQETTNHNHHNEISLHTHYEGYTTKYKYQQVLAKIWRNWNPHTLLVETYNSAATLENSLAVPQKVKQILYDPEIPLQSTCPRKKCPYKNHECSQHYS